eukprot:5987887-Amphidinium_carterae.1
MRGYHLEELSHDLFCRSVEAVAALHSVGTWMATIFALLARGRHCEQMLRAMRLFWRCLMLAFLCVALFCASASVCNLGRRYANLCHDGALPVRGCWRSCSSPLGPKWCGGFLAHCELASGGHTRLQPLAVTR